MAFCESNRTGFLTNDQNAFASACRSNYGGFCGAWATPCAWGWDGYQNSYTCTYYACCVGF